MDISELFWNAGLEEIKCGYIEHEDHYMCLLCGKIFEKGIIYAEDEVLYESGRYVRVHIEKAHESVFSYLIDLDKKLTGLTDHQKSVLRLFFQGKNDQEMQKELGIGSASTIRNHRFVLKEKERQAKVFLAMMELLKEKDQYAPAILNPPRTARMVDQRYNLTRQENDMILKKYFPDGRDGPLKDFPKKEKYKLVILREIAQRLDRERIYDEAEVSAILENIYYDHAVLRRYLIEYGFLDRKTDGSEYWVKK